MGGRVDVGRQPGVRTTTAYVAVLPTEWQLAQLPLPVRPPPFVRLPRNEAWLFRFGSRKPESRRERHFRSPSTSGRNAAPPLQVRAFAPQPAGNNLAG